MKRGKPLKRKTPLKKRSEKKKALDSKRSVFVRDQLKDRLYCEAGPVIGKHLGQGGRWTECWRLATELHEPLTRARAPGADTILDKANSVAVCRRCHDWIHGNVATSEEIGLLIRSGRLPL